MRLTATRGVKNTLLWTIAMVLPMALACLGKALTGAGAEMALLGKIQFLYSLMLLVNVMPWALCIAGTVGGWGPMAAGVCACMVTMGMVFGPAGLLFGALLYLVPCAVFVWLNEKQIDFKRSSWIMAASLFGTQLIAMLALRMLVPNGDIFSAAALAAGTQMTDTGNLGEELLRAMKQYGLAGVTAGSISQATGDLIYEMVSASMPVWLVQNSILFGVGGLAMSQHFGQRSLIRRGVEESFPDLKMPPLREWKIPRGWGIAFGVTGLGYIVQMFAATDSALYFAGTMLFGVFHSVFTLQGIAMLNFIQHKRGSGRTARVIVPALLLVFLPVVPVVMGVMDQLTNVRIQRGDQDNTIHMDDDNRGGDTI